MKKSVLVGATCLLSAMTSGIVSAEEDKVKLYTLDCGRIEMLDLDLFADNGAFKGRKNSAADACYLIRHPKGDLLWDTGLPEALHEQKGGVTNGPFHLERPKTLKGQLADIGVKPEDIEYVSVSHSHFDHAANLNDYAASTWIVHEKEYELMFSDASRANAQSFAAYDKLENSQKVMFDTPHDVFGDGTVEIIPMVGHTPGHSVLKLELANTGTVLLTGDLYHLQESRELKTVPRFNTNADDTRMSIEAFEKLAQKTNARVVIQHVVKDFEAMPQIPAYLD
ncbi:N-acyl homoserine lactonase family protein [Kordiimonas sp. SCSIO 12610]|uniref:N-acyl homoserine lactonase family protein n=1 Tax=Kordiimonas sp. SCSIO 12610 TaxID=2829597 RepID=UPI00210CB4F5|nr:N-acyl homoserine lactonase family protein [Kordiimonas sp. SCSIO 12610]UTW54577.1 N-acyl homoserine lactonase family protein [Kordiimonas sp. SCSIO 12610]